MNISELRLYDANPRTITDGAMKKLQESISRDPQFMALRPLVIDENNTVLGGNQRLKAIRLLGYTEIPDEWVVKASDLSEEQKKRFILVDNAPEGMSGDWDIALLSEQYGIEELGDLGFDLDELGIASDGGNLEGVLDDKYTKKIIPPIYEPKGEEPGLDELMDREKADKLIAEIEKAEIPEDVAMFLKASAERHIVFHFGKIAEFYCHADAKVQDLMERSGLVIIDFDKAIENGFVHMTERLGDLADLADELEESSDDA